MFLIQWVVLAIVFLGLAHFLPGIKVDGFWSAFWAAVVLSLINFCIRPVLIFFTLPLNILTFGLLTFVINALMLWLVSAIVPGFSFTNFGWAFIVALVVTAVKMFFFR